MASSSTPSTRRLITGSATQAIYLPAAALFAAEALGCDQKGRSQILGCDTQEAEGYLVEPDGTVSLLRRPR